VTLFVGWWIAVALVCAIGGLCVHHQNRLAGFVLGAIFGPIGVVVAAIANSNATMERVLAKLPSDPTRAPVPAVGREWSPPHEKQSVPDKSCA
jgi:hypothetical protein